MAWGVNPVDRKKIFCEAILKKGITISEGCRQFSISRPTAYEWLNNYKRHGVQGLQNLSSARHTQAHKTNTEKEDTILLTKYEFPHFGPKKILPKLRERWPELDWPCVTTINSILKSNGLVRSKRVRKLLAETHSSLYSAKHPNDVWCMDFKGWHLTKDSQKFDPFTVTDQDSRYLIKCNKLSSNCTEHVWNLLDSAFREYGLPFYLRSDNGPPFATSCPGRLSKLSIKLIKAGVTPEWIEPGKPQQNGRHERMHLTMEKEGFVFGSSAKEQVRNLENFLLYYNFERPHEALGQKTPGSIYTSSPRVWHGRFNEIEYPSDHEIGKVRGCGKVPWKGGDVYVSRVLAGETVGIKEAEEGYEMYFKDLYLGIILGNRLEVERRKGRKRWKPTKK